MKELKEKEAHKRWMNIHKKLKTASDAIANSTELKEQRDHFDELSDNMTLGIQSFGINKKVYYQYCPMKNENGAYWLSVERKIKNPYFGEAMLKCGEIIHTLD